VVAPGSNIATCVCGDENSRPYGRLYLDHGSRRRKKDIEASKIEVTFIVVVYIFATSRVCYATYGVV